MDILRNDHGRSSVVREDESNKLWQTRKKFEKSRIGKVAKALEIWRKFFPGSSGVAVAVLVCLSSLIMVVMVIVIINK